MKKRVTAVIPARMAASRFPGKPLAKILDLPMIEHVRRRVLLSEVVDDVYVATCDKVIMSEVEKFGGNAIMTADTHERCTDRVEEAAEKLKTDIIVIVQGDEPLFFPGVIEKLIEPMLFDEKVYCVNVLSLIKNRKDLSDIDIVKAVVNKKQNIIYYSRAPIPHFRVDNNAPCYRQTGISAFTPSFLSNYTSLPPTPLEIAESIDFLRIIEHGYVIQSVIVSQETIGVDREEDVKIAENIIRNDPLQSEYYNQILKL